MSRRIVDLSLDVYSDCPGHPLGIPTIMEDFATHAKDGFRTTRMTIGSHCGTHMDAPEHFLPGKPSIDRINLAQCIGPALLVDLHTLTNQEHVRIEHLEPYANDIAANTRLILRTDVSRQYGQKSYFSEFPGVSREAARWLADRRIALIGVESFAIHPTDYNAVHKILLAENIVIVEGLAHLDELRMPRFEFIALPLRLRGGDGSPVRAVAIEEDAT